MKFAGERTTNHHMARRTMWFSIILLQFGCGLLSACQGDGIEPFAEKNQLKEKSLQSPEGQALLENKWCAYIDKTSAFTGFLRLSFSSDQQMLIERYAEVNGAPFAKSDDDRIGRWKFENNVLGVYMDKNDIRFLKLSLDSRDNIMILNTTDTSDPQKMGVMWVCNNNIETDPIPSGVVPAPSDSDPIPGPNDDPDDLPPPTDEEMGL